MKKIVDDTRLIYKCCSLYYEEQLGQQDICRVLGVSRPSVSRMLKLGRELGIVRIDVINPRVLSYSTLERQLERLFFLREAVVVCNSPAQHGADSRPTALASAGLSYLNRVLKNSDFVGVSMGRTLHTLIHSEIPDLQPVHCTFVPMVGGVGEGIETHANFLAGEFARRFGGERMQLYSPALFTDPHILEGFRREEAVRPIFDSYTHLDTAVFSIGILDGSESTALRLKYVDKETLEAFSDAGAIGDISLQYYDIHGDTTLYDSYNHRVAGLSLTQLRHVPRRIAVAGGKDKVQAVLGALHGGFVNVLVTDEECARELIRLEEEKEG